MELRIATTWSGQAVGPDEQVVVGLHDDGDLVLSVQAPWHWDPLPDAPPGPVPGLWDHEVVELFILGSDERYLEVELGPGGHHLVLRLEGRRQVLEQGLPLAAWARPVGDRWTAQARIPRSWLPPGPHRINAYAIHGQGDQRRYLAWSPTGGDAPDFHRLEAFRAVELP